MMKAFTFLGRGKLHKSTYVFNGKKKETQFFAEAIVEFFEPESLFFFATDSAAKEPVSDDNKKERLRHITELLNGKTNVVHIPIEEGADEKELWDIFNTVVAQIDDNDRVLFDITHGFRSLPFLTFLALAYVRNVRSGVEIERVIYGAYEAVERNNPEKPVFDLTPFVSLLDWMNAVNVFQNSGDARPIAQLQKVPRNIAEVLTSLSNALLTNCTLEAQEAAMQFNTVMQSDSLSFGESKQPFQILIEQLHKSYAHMAVNEPYNDRSKVSSHKKQVEQIKWYVENQHYLQAITLMQEWIISWKCIEDGKNWLSRDRDTIRQDLNERAELIESQIAESLAPLASDLPAIELWKKCRGIRNDLTHCGMSDNPEEAAEAIRKIKNLFEDFKEFEKSVYN